MYWCNLKQNYRLWGGNQKCKNPNYYRVYESSLQRSINRCCSHSLSATFLPSFFKLSYRCLWCCCCSCSPSSSSTSPASSSSPANTFFDGPPAQIVCSIACLAMAQGEGRREKGPKSAFPCSSWQGWVPWLSRNMFVWSMYSTVGQFIHISFTRIDFLLFFASAW